MNQKTKKILLDISFTEPPGLVLSKEEIEHLSKTTIRFFQLTLEDLAERKKAEQKPRRDPNPDAI